MTSSSTISDFLSILPALEIAFQGQGGAHSLVVECLFLRCPPLQGDLGFLRFFRAFRALRILRAHRVLSFYAPGATRQLMAKSLQIVSLLFVVTGLVHALEVSTARQLSPFDQLCHADSLMDHRCFQMSLIFTRTTVTTHSPSHA